MYKKITFLLAALCCCTFISGAEPLKKKALIVMIDGLRADAFDTFKPATMTKLKNGQWQPGYKGKSGPPGFTV